MFMEERQKEIVLAVNEKGRVLVSELQEKYGVTADCVRRDLRLLESRGLLKRTHGGAIPAPKKGIYPEEMYNPKELEEVRPSYLAVAKRAVTYIQENDVIYLTTSSIGYYMACCLPEDISVTIVTNSVTIAERLRTYGKVRVLLLGGEMSHHGNCHDFYTVQMMKGIRVDKAFLSHSALSTDFGASIHNSAGVELGRVIMQNSSVNIGLYPAEKTGRSSVYSVCGAEEYDVILTDEHTSPDFIGQLTEKGVKVDVTAVEG